MKKKLFLVIAVFLVFILLGCSGKKETKEVIKKKKKVVKVDYSKKGELALKNKSIAKAAFYYNLSSNKEPLEKIRAEFAKNMEERFGFDEGFWESSLKAKPAYYSTDMVSKNLIILKPRIKKNETIKIPWLSKSGQMVPIVFDWVVQKDSKEEFNKFVKAMLKDHSKYEKIIINGKVEDFDINKKGIIKMNVGVKAGVRGKNIKFFTYSYVNWSPKGEYKPIIFYWNPNESSINKRTLPGSEIDAHFYITGHDGKKDCALSNFVRFRFAIMRNPKD